MNRPGSGETIPLFGRSQDLDNLDRLVADSSITILSGRPQVGKSRLLEAFRARRREHDSFLVGYYESSKETPDLLLRALADLYASWLAETSWRSQGASLIARHKDSLVGGIGSRIGQMLTKVLRAGGTPRVISSVVNETFSDLARLDRELKTGGIELPRLDYETTLELVSIIGSLSSKRPILILDAFEQSPNPVLEAGPLAKILRNLTDWPPFNIVIASRNEPRDQTAIRTLENLAQASARANLYVLEELELGEGSPARADVLGFLRKSFPFTNSLSADQLIQLTGGHPGVLARWIEGNATTERDLIVLSQEAQDCRYPEVEKLLAALAGEGSDAARLAARLALFPELVNEEVWEFFAPVLTDGLDSSALVQLQSRGVLNHNARFPSFGHTTRYEYARRWWTTDRVGVPLARREAEHLLLDLVERITQDSPHPISYSAAFVYVGGSELSSNLQQDVITVSASVLVLVSAEFGVALGPRFLTLALKAARRYRNCAFVIAMALEKVHEQAYETGDLQHAAATLECLRTLETEFPDNSSVHIQLASGLFEAHERAVTAGDGAGRDLAIQELHTLAAKHPDEGTVGALFGAVIANTLVAPGDRPSLLRLEPLVDELRALQTLNPHHAKLGRVTAGAIFNLMNLSRTVGSVEREDQLLAELRRIAQSEPNDNELQETLAGALVNCLTGPFERSRMDSRISLFDRLRTLYQKQPDNAVLRDRFSKGLANLRSRAHEQGNDVLRDACLAELGELSARHPEDSTVRGVLANSCVHSVKMASEKRDPSHRDKALDQLIRLETNYPDDTHVEHEVAMALAQVVVIDAQREDMDQHRLERLTKLFARHIAAIAKRKQSRVLSS